MKEQAGKDVYLMGGAEITASLIAVGLVDELRLLVYPLLAGEGVPLFTSAVGRRALHLKELSHRPEGLVSVIYQLG